MRWHFVCEAVQARVGRCSFLEQFFADLDPNLVFCPLLRRLAAREPAAAQPAFGSGWVSHLQSRPPVDLA